MARSFRTVQSFRRGRTPGCTPCDDQRRPRHPPRARRQQRLQGCGRRPCVAARGARVSRVEPVVPEQVVGVVDEQPLRARGSLSPGRPLGSRRARPSELGRACDSQRAPADGCALPTAPAQRRLPPRALLQQVAQRPLSAAPVSSGKPGAGDSLGPHSAAREREVRASKLEVAATSADWTRRADSGARV